MSKCRNCNIEVLDETERCPLCGSVLEHTVEVENMYPKVRIRARKLTLISNIYLFCAILLEVLCLAINVEQHPDVWWSLIVGLVLLYGYLLLRFAILGKSGYKGKTVILTAIAILVMVGIDWAVGYQGWSVNFVLPSGIMLIDIGILVCMIINRRNWQSYMMWQIFMMICSIVLLILCVLGVITVPVPSWVALGFSVFLFLGTLIIGDRRARVELKRRFHIR